MFARLARITTVLCIPETAPPGSTSGRSVGITCSAVRYLSWMTSTSSARATPNANSSTSRRRVIILSDGRST